MKELLPDTISHTGMKLSIVALSVVASAGLALCGCHPVGAVRNDLDKTSSRPDALTGRSVPGTLQASPDPAQDPIQPGDQVQISVWGYPEFNSTVTVEQAGSVTLPLIGDIQAASLTKEEFKNELRQRLSKYIKDDIKLTVSVIDLVHQRVSVMGAVNRQDNYPVMQETSLVQLLSMAGGTTTDADLRNVRIYRNGIRNDAIDVDLTRRMENGDMQSIPPVRPGDIIYVPRQENVVREMSDFARDALLLFGFFRVLY